MYRQWIAEIAGPAYDPRHIEAYMRVEHSTLDRLGSRFEREVKIAMECVREGGSDMAERVAKSFGF